MKFINALVVKLVDTKDLKSFAACGVPVRGLAEETPLMNKVQIISDKNPKSFKIKTLLQKIIKKMDLRNLILLL